jgi:hypothetical protein
MANRELVFTWTLAYAGNPVQTLSHSPNNIAVGFRRCCVQTGPTTPSRQPSLIGKGTAPWHRIFEPAEGAGRVRFYLVQPEGSGEPPLARSQERPGALSRDSPATRPSRARSSLNPESEVPEWMLIW